MAEPRLLAVLVVDLDVDGLPPKETTAVGNDGGDAEEALCVRAKGNATLGRARIPSRPAQ